MMKSADKQGARWEKGWREYRVRFPKNDRERSMALSPWSERTVGFRIAEEHDVDDGREVVRMRKIDTVESGARLIWTFDLDPERGWLRRLEKSFVHEDGRAFAHVVYDLEDSAWEYPTDLCHVFSITALLQRADLKNQRRGPFHLLVAEDSVPWRIYYKVEKSEIVSVPAGRFDCYRIVLKPDYGQILGRWAWAWRVISPFVPDFHFWVEKKAPHRWVKFTGHLGPVGASSLQVYELTSVEE